MSANPASFAHAQAEAPPIRLVLPYPISANAYWSSRAVPKKGTKKSIVITYVTDEARAYKQDVGKLALVAGVRRPITGRISLTVRLYPARPQDWAKRARQNPDGWDDTVRSIDLDNALKVLLDALKNIAFDDDAWVRRIDAERMEPDDRGARVEVHIAPVMRQAIAPGLF
ncbi:RusA family crossover junction endodeoxyribonuclease [Frateuria edaphi]|uniref:RusA family crossover junction endodeoxyribonuclease n=1 Tax=Frateuria edaphi TaxID=2898793 RepID=UPI001E323F52|nr:RusA family crossover junction endodeoxyribonuclease [Frateuria edaphi]UGB46974.1 RusA family crossover junction endodeoxyribonuclease [Frateuria edaphi]